MTAVSAASRGDSAAGRPIPAVGPPRRAPLPTVAERTVQGGLRILAVRRAGVPLVELRLRIPLPGRKPTTQARTTVLSEAFFSGTPGHSAVQLAATLQTLGGGLDCGIDADALTVSGSALSPSLPALLSLLAELLTSNAYPKDELAGHRERLVEHLRMARSQPSTVAHEAAVARLFGTHPYGRALPHPDEVAAVRRADLRTLHEQSVRPDGGVLVLVGDITPSRVLDLAEAALEPWQARGSAPQPLPPVPAFTPGGVVLVDRPGSVQTSMRLVGVAPDRGAEDYPATVLANMVFGGYFSSRLVANIREDKGYTYSPHSSIDHAERASSLSVDADVAAEVTGAALLETRYELGRIVSVPVEQEELDAARRYVTGSLALSVASQAGLAGMLTRLVQHGLSVSWLRDYPAALQTVTVEQVQAAAVRWLAPTALATVLVGDAELVRRQVAPLEPVP